MKKLLLTVSLFFLVCGAVYAAPVIYNDTASAFSAVSITSNVATVSRSKGVWIGTTQSLDFSFDGTTWVTFQGATAGTVIPIQVVGARITSGTANPNAGDVVFLY